MGLCFVSIKFCGSVGLVGRGSGWPVGLVGPLVWWACGSVGGPVGQVDLFVFIAKSPTLRGPTCQGVLGLVLIIFCIFFFF